MFYIVVHLFSIVYSVTVVATYNVGIIDHSYTSKYCELKGGNIGIVEKAQETRFGRLSLLSIAYTLG